MPKQVITFYNLVWMLRSSRVGFFLRGMRAARGRRQRRTAVLTTAAGQPGARGRILVISIIDSTLTPPKGHDPHFQKGISGYIRNALHSFLFAFCAHQVWPPWHLPKCCSEILSITGLEVSEGISNRAWTHGLHRRINRYLTPQTVISHHEARLSANSLCPVLQIYGALYK